jgi:hypothetical protein
MTVLPGPNAKGRPFVNNSICPRSLYLDQLCLAVPAASLEFFAAATLIYDVVFV